MFGYYVSVPLVLAFNFTFIFKCRERVTICVGVSFGCVFPFSSTSKLSVSFTTHSFILLSSRLFGESHAYVYYHYIIRMKYCELWYTYKISFINDPFCRTIAQCQKTFRQTYEIRVLLSMPNPPFKREPYTRTLRQKYINYKTVLWGFFSFNRNCNGIFISHRPSIHIIHRQNILSKFSFF